MVPAACIFFRRRAAGLSRGLAFPAPSFSMRVTFQKNSDAVGAAGATTLIVLFAIIDEDEDASAPCHARRSDGTMPLALERDVRVQCTAHMTSQVNDRDGRCAESP